MMVLKHLKSRLFIALFCIIAVSIVFLGYNYSATASFFLNVEARRVDNVKTRQTDSVAIRQTDNVHTRQTDNVDTQTDNVDTRQTDNVDTRQTDNVDTQVNKPVSTAPCACSHCISAEDKDPWFTKRFKRNIPLLLSQKNSGLSKSTYNWWRRLQRQRKPANYGDVVKRLFQVVPGEEHYKDAGPNRCRTCAVVGNSFNLKRSGYGPLIDSNDFVFRINKAPTSGYEDDVGIRTTHRVMYPESATNLQNGTHLMLVPFKTIDLQWLTSALTTGAVKRTRIPVMAKIDADKSKVLILHPTFIYYVYFTWVERHGKYPSTGFLTLIFALHICDEVNVFGFGAAKNRSWQHYWEKNKFKRRRPTGNHPGSFEHNITKTLASKKKIKMFKGK